MKKYSAQFKKAFTLTEVMIVVASAGLLSAIVVPNIAQARSQSHTHSCISNLQKIHSAKYQWAMENLKSETATPSETELSGYFRAQKLPTCPSKGVYTLNSVGTWPECSLQMDGHGLQHTD